MSRDNRKVFYDKAKTRVIVEIQKGERTAAVSEENTMEWNLTGSWRIFRPSYVTKDAPCKLACPVMENIPEWIALLKNGEMEKAWRLYIQNNPFPAICGRVCFKFCEAKCNRAGLDEPVAVNSLERYLGDWALSRGWQPEKTKESDGVSRGSVAGIGGGPGGAAAGFFLRLRGFAVTIYEAEQELGGMLHLGIPRYRLPRMILREEIKNNVLSLGVDLRLDVRIDLERFRELKNSYDRVIVALGAHHSKNLGVSGEDLPGVLSGLEFLGMVNDFDSGIDFDFGERVLVIGGGNTAIDAARSATRLLSVKSVTILYRRSINEMPAHKEEVEQALAEGVEIKLLVAPFEICQRGDGLILKCREMTLGEPDQSGRREPHPIEGSDFEVAADTVIKAIGEDNERNIFGVALPADARGMTGRIYEFDKKIIVLGDALTGPVSVTHAIAAGKMAARIIAGENTDEGLGVAVEYGDLNLDYFEKTARTPPCVKSLRPGVDKNFHEINRGFLGLRHEAYREASRCMSCGFCNFFDKCFNFCPDGVIVKTENGYRINYDFCKGCGICFTECPRSAIRFAKEGE